MVLEKSKQRSHSHNIPVNTELVGLVFELSSPKGGSIYPQCAIALHAWFLDQVRQFDPQLSAYLHDGESEKPFTISGLEGLLLTQGRNLQLQVGETYRWYITALSSSVVEWLAAWLQRLPKEIELRDAPLKIDQVAIRPSSHNLRSTVLICI